MKLSHYYPHANRDHARTYTAVNSLRFSTDVIRRSGLDAVSCAKATHPHPSSTVSMAARRCRWSLAAASLEWRLVKVCSVLTRKWFFDPRNAMTCEVPHLFLQNLIHTTSRNPAHRRSDHVLSGLAPLPGEVVNVPHTGHFDVETTGEQGMSHNFRVP